MTGAGAGACPYSVDVGCGSRQDYDCVHVVWHYLERIDVRTGVQLVHSFKSRMNHRARGIQLHDAISDTPEPVDPILRDNGDEVRASSRIIVSL